jgi:magnesium transporter
MIRLLNTGQATLRQVDSSDLRQSPTDLDEAIWIDLLNPTQEESALVEKQLKIEMLTKEEMHEIEESSRLFESDGALYMSCWLISYDSPIPENTSVTFVMTPKHFVSIRHSDHHPVRIFCTAPKRVQFRPFRTPDEAFVELIDAVVNQLAATLRQVEQSLNTLSLEIFADKKERGGSARNSNLKDVVQRLGKRNALVGSLRESAVSFQNITPFFVSTASEWIRPELTGRLRTIERDMRSLREYDAQLSAEINFLLDSTIGLINIEQNQGMKILSVAALLLAFV